MDVHPQCEQFSSSSPSDPVAPKTQLATQALRNAALMLPKCAKWLQESFIWLEQVEGADRKFHRLATAVDKESLLDLLTEIRFARLFDQLGFQILLEPLGAAKGPDLKISRDGHGAFVEVTRFREMNQGPPPVPAKLNEAFLLESYGNPRRDIIKGFRRIRMKFGQVSDEPSLIALWNDDEDLEELEVQHAVSEIRSDPKAQEIIPSGLRFLVYGSTWVKGTGQQVFCFPFLPLEDLYLSWARELEASRL